MTPDRNPKRPLKKRSVVGIGEIEKSTRPSSNDPHEIVFFQRHIDDDFDDSDYAKVRILGSEYKFRRFE